MPSFDLTPRQVTLVYDEDCGVCTSLARWLARVSKGRVSIQGAPLTDSMIVECDGERTTHAAAIAALSRAFPAPIQLVRVCAWPGVRVLANAGYRFVARHRHRISAWLGLEQCRVPATSGRARAKRDQIVESPVARNRRDRR
jgi:predicted DCC family thiol-disulfide oxidoreductase YuxK